MCMSKSDKDSVCQSIRVSPSKALLRMPTPAPLYWENLEMTHFLRTFAFASANFTTSWQSATSYDKIILANTKNIHRHGVIA